MIKIIEKVTVKKSIIATLIFFVMLWLIDYSPIGIAGLLKVSNAYEFSRAAQQNLCRNRDNHFCKKKLYYL